MRAEILCVGSELLLGQITDTNAVYMAQQLARAGVDLHRKQTVGDNLGRIAEAISAALRRADVLIITGGLGPTTDDLTREAIALALGVDLEFHEELAQPLRDFFAKRGIPLGDSTLRQAYLPATCVELHNPVGTAPGVRFDGDFEGQNKLIFAVPGVPREMKAMLDGGIIPALLEKSEGAPHIIVSRVLRAFGIGESQLAEPLEDILTTAQNPTVAPLIYGNTEVHLRLTAKAENEAHAQKLLDEMEDKIRARVGEWIFGRDEQSLQQIVVEKLTSRGASVGVAESLTSGILGAYLTDTTGSSAVFFGGVLAYAPSIKEEILGVSAADIEKYTVVSAEVAAQMAAGVRRMTGATFGLSTTGEAGPEPATHHPVGTVFFGLALPNGETRVEKREFFGDREAIRRRSALGALDMLRRWLDENQSNEEI